MTYADGLGGADVPGREIRHSLNSGFQWKSKFKILILNASIFDIKIIEITNKYLTRHSVKSNEDATCAKPTEHIPSVAMESASQSKEQYFPPLNRIDFRGGKILPPLTIMRF